MAASTGILRAYHDGPMLTFQVEGQATMYHGLPLRRMAEKSIAEGARLLQVDLRHCTYMDSTFIGTLLLLKRNTGREGFDLVLLSPSAQCQRLLHQMGVDGFCPMITVDELPTSSWIEIACGVDEPNQFNDNLLEAHQELASLPGPVSAPFQGIVRHLSQELGRTQP